MVMVILNTSGGIMSVEDKLKKSVIELLLLSLLQEDDMYGYEITQKLSQKSENVFDYKEGSIYPILYRAEGQGLISCNNQIVQNRIRAYYHLEQPGKEYLKKSKDEYFYICHYVDVILGQSGGSNGN